MARRYLCAKHGAVQPVAVQGIDPLTRVKKASGGKIAAGVLTGGTSLLFTGVRSRKMARTTVLVCPKCKTEVVEA
jgi:hypothetical protein